MFLIQTLHSISISFFFLVFVFLMFFLFSYPMGDDEEIKKPTKTYEMENLSLNSSSSSRDLLQQFMSSPGDLGPKDDENEEVELNLGLSLGGRFGVDRTTNKLMRSSSVATYLPVERYDSTVAGGSQAPPPPASQHTGLVRTSSLPVMDEEELKKRKEMQSLRRMEAKRRRSEKQRSLRGETAAGGGGGLNSGVEDRREVEVGLKGGLEREKSLPPAMGRPPVGLMRAGSQPSRAIWTAMAAKGKEGCLGRQGSLESMDVESKPPKVSSGELSPGSIQSLPEGLNQETGSPAARLARTDPEGPPRIPTNRGGPEIGISALEDMPSVFTIQKAQRVDGILYKYGKGEEVKIMCVCHGSFFSPGEFIRHAGGPDVDNPLKHIVVNGNSHPPL